LAVAAWRLPWKISHSKVNAYLVRRLTI